MKIVLSEKEIVAAIVEKYGLPNKKVTDINVTAGRKPAGITATLTMDEEPVVVEESTTKEATKDTAASSTAETEATTTEEPASTVEEEDQDDLFGADAE